MKYKYQADFDKLKKKCPPETYTSRIINAHRWVFDTIDHEDNFKSQYHKHPRRYNSKDDERKCKGMALSMFINSKFARERFKFFRDEEGWGDRAYKELGTNIAYCKLTAKDGVNGHVDGNGHYNHHPLENNNYEERFEIKESLRE